ncbi:hypothetical protein EV363DRAFT_1452740 [Boletus edulis]|nr:hypothetical protein EV363DRAFT_1452740 [Boletus edulis]
MSFDIQSALELLVLNNHLSVLIVSAVVYDYILTFSRESTFGYGAPIIIEIQRPQCFHSADRGLGFPQCLLPCVRYIGLCWIVTNALVFLSAVDLVMILRVYAMWNRSRMVLYILLFIYVLQTIITVVLDGIYDNPNTHLSVTVAQVLDFSFCKVSYFNTPSTLAVYRVAPRFVLSAALVIFAVSQTLKQSFGMYKATKQWQPNRYMQKLVGDGILYFIVYVPISFLPTELCSCPGHFSIKHYSFGRYMTVTSMVASIFDTGFGLRSRSNPGLDTTVSAMVFVGGDQGPEVESGTDNSGDLELGHRRHGSGLNEGSLIGARE